MVAHWRVIHPPPEGAAKLIEHRRITTRDRVCNNPSYAVQWDVIDAEAPDEVFDVADVLLMGFCGKQCFEQPSSIRDLPDVADLRQG